MLGELIGRLPGGPWRRAGAVAVLCLLVAGSLPVWTSRMAEILVLGALLAACGWSGWRVAGAVVPGAGVASRGVCALTAAVGLVTCSATALGHCGWLRLAPFLWVVALGFVASLFLRPVPLRGDDVPGAGRAIRLDFEAVLLIAAALALALRLGGSAVHVWRDADAFVSYDDLSYHLSTVAVWHHSGDLRGLKFETGDPSPTFYPFVTELCAWALLAPLDDCDILARRVQLLFALGSLVAVAAIGRRLGLSQRSALLAVLLYATVDRAFPVLAFGAGNDHSTCFFTLAALDGGLELLRRPSRRSAAYAGAALGLLIGTKYIGLYFAATVCAALLMARAGADTARTPEAEQSATAGGAVTGRCRGRQAWHGWRGVGLAGVLAGAMVLCGGYAYARNAWTAGNPVFPAPVSILGLRLLPGWGAAAMEWRRHLPEFRIDTVSFLTRRGDLFGPVFAWTMLPGALAAPVAALLLRRRRDKEGRTRTLPAVLFALPVVFFLEFRFLMHDHRDLRYVLSGLAMAAVAAAWLAATADGRAGIVLRCAMLAGIALAAASHLHLSIVEQLVLLAFLCLLGALGVWAAKRLRATPARMTGRTGWRRVAAPASLAAFAAAAAAAVWAGALGVTSYQAAKLHRQPAAAALDAATPRGARIAYVGSNQPYLFFGARLQNDVQVVPTDADGAAQWYTWGGSVHFPFDGASAGRWRANLAARQVDLVVAARSPDEGPERAWMASAPAEFTMLYRDAQTEIWRVNRRTG